MRAFLVALIVGVVMAAPSPAPQDDNVIKDIGPCPTDCWNEAASKVNCDPNSDDDCLCGPFFDDVTSCVSQTCSLEENLSVLAFLDSAC